MLSATAIVLLVLLALLAVPVTLTYELNWQQKLRGEARLEWLFGLVRVRLAPPRGNASAPKIKISDDATRPRAKTARKKSNPLAALRQKSFRQRTLRFGRDIWRAFRKRDLNLRIRVGLGDPAETGQLWALFGPLSGLLANIEDASIALEPEFIDAVFELDSSGKISVIPLQLLYLVLGLLCSPSFWRGMQRMRQAA
ncbi:MAG: DUF2953 domain-containing protein [Gammaproteobacteria bacterium]|nr:DUF2953 domain-containing protein [Gammaproteobacteria bacterium]MDH3858364.1 DUF2953 domain-containing protein [Gammaproteobacteria bacterium]